MRWKQLRKSRNIEDRRGQSAGRGMRRGGGGGMKVGGGAGIILLLLGLFFGQDLIGPLSSGGANIGAPQLGQQTNGTVAVRNDDEAGQFISSILGTTEDVWGNKPCSLPNLTSVGLKAMLIKS